MSSSMSKNFRLSSSVEEQGIVSILGSDCERTKSAVSLRRTLSADMSSKKWQSQHDFSPLKKIASFGEFPVTIPDSASLSSSESEEENELPGQLEIWNSIQEEKKKKMELENPAQIDMWSLILSQKAQEDSKTLPPPYIHPLVKRSSSLSEKSLEICTESLGSETGSDGFSSYPPSETGDAEEDKEEEQHEEGEEEATSKYEMEWRAARYDVGATSKKSSSRSFPPPLPSLSRRDGASVHMRSRRDSGRLVLEAVSVTSKNNFRAERQDGRLVLTFVNNLNKEDDKSREEMNEEESDTKMFEIEMENSADEKENEDESETEEEEMKEAASVKQRGSGGGGSGDVRFVMEEAPKLCGSVTNVHRLAIMVKKPIIVGTTNLTWSNKFDEIVQFKGVEEVVKPTSSLAQSLPPRPPVARMIPIPSAEVAVATTTKAAAAATTFNAYEYYWKAKPGGAVGVATAAAISVVPSESKDKNNTSSISKNLLANEKQELLILRGNKRDYLVPLSKGCKEPKRSLFIWEPYCIATS